MKKIYLACLIILSIHNGVKAQLTLTKAANEPISGDSWLTEKFDSTTVVPKNTGTGQTWNFSTFATTSQTNVTTYTTAASVTGYSSFPGSTLAELKGGSESGFYKSSGSNFEFMGFYDNSGPTVLTLTNAAIMATWPISYGNTTNDLTNGTMTSGTMNINFNGSITTNASGSGTVILPGGKTFTNCLMVVANISLAIGATDSYTEKRYSFYHSSEKFPIAEYWYETNVSGSVTNTSFGLDVSSSALATGLNELSEKESQILIYPNPAKNWLNIETGSDKPVTVKISDITGKTMTPPMVTNRVNISELNPGLYFITIENGSHRITKRLMITD